MAQLSVNLNGRNYRFNCGDGDEARLQELAAFVSRHLGALSNEFGHVGDDRLMVMSLLMLADDLLEARDRVSALEKLLPTKELSKLAELSAARSGEAGDEAEADGLADLEAELPQKDEKAAPERRAKG